MASTGGLTRRRGGGRAAGEDDGGDQASPSPNKNGPTSESRAPETSFTDSANGHKIAFDPRDLSESAERSRLPKLTLMEEVLLLGLKDKQVGCF
jgi:golgi phosphoprotein 3